MLEKDNQVVFLNSVKKDEFLLFRNLIIFVIPKSSNY